MNGSDEGLSEKEVRLINYDDHADHFSELRNLIDRSKFNSKELLLEVEIDDSLKDLLSRGNCKDLVDVTIIPESQPGATVSLGVNEVSDFLEMVHQHNGGEEAAGKKRSAELKSSSEEGQNVRNHYFDCVNGQEIPTPPENQVEYDIDAYYKPEKQAVYTTPYTFEGLKKKLPCLDPRTHEEKPGTPCLCQHCGMVGVLVESQKRPAIPHTPNPKYTPPKHGHFHHRKRPVDPRSKGKSETNLLLLRELSDKISTLEERLNQYESKTVQKDYFKFVIHKLLTQYSHKINELKNNRANNNMATQYSRTTTRRNKSWDKHQTPERDNKYSQYNAAATLLESKDSLHRRKPRSASRSRPRTREDKPKTGDIRDKIASLLVEKDKSRKARSRKPNDVLKLPSNMDDIKLDQHPGKTRHVYMASNQARTPFHYHRSVTPPKLDAPLMDVLEKEIDENMSSQTIRQLCDLVYNKYYEKTVAQKDVAKNEIPDKLLKTGRPPGKEGKVKARSSLKVNDVDVSYVNPAVKEWDEQQSTDDFGVARRQSGSKKSNRHTIEEKIKYLKTLARRKNVDETELWNNILNQAKKHIKSNEDTVSIQLPGGPNNSEMSELELTLSNLKEIVKKSKCVKKNRSCLSIELNYRTSSENYVSKRGCLKKKKLKL